MFSFREGFNLRKLNTAATLWTEASMGLWAGTGQYLPACVVKGMVILVNLERRPLSRLLDREPAKTTELLRNYAVAIVWRSAEEAHVRALMPQDFASSGLYLTALDSENSGRVEVTAQVNAQTVQPLALEQIVGRLGLEPAVIAARWRMRTLVERHSGSWIKPGSNTCAMAGERDVGNPR